MMRGLVVLALVAALSFAARSFLVDASEVTGSGAALAFGFLLLAAIQTGHVFHALRLPHLTGFLLCGALFGPEVLGLVTPRMIKDLALVKNVAVGLIALNAGCELNFRRLYPKLKSIGFISALGLPLAFMALFGFLFSVSKLIPFMQDMTTPQRLVVTLICANVLTALSPAVVMGIISETRAEGPLTELCLSIVVLADLAISIAFAFSDSAATAVFPHAGGPEHSVFGALALHILGSIGMGIGVGAVFAVYIRRIALRIGLFVFAVCFVVAEAGSTISLNPLLVGLAAGLFLENVSPVSGHEVIHETEAAAAPTFAVFFAVIGAEVHLHDFLTVAPFAVGAAVSRAIGLWIGARLGAKAAGVDPAVARRVPFGMFPQAGIAIALANLVGDSFGAWGLKAKTLLLGTIVVNETVGPVLFRSALARAGEIGKKKTEGSVHKPSHASIAEDTRDAAFAEAVARVSTVPPPRG